MRAKRILCLLLCFFCLSAAALAAEPVSIQADGKTILFDEMLPPMVLSNNQTYFPVRPAFESLGYSVNWNNETRTLTAVRAGRTVRFSIDSSRITLEEHGAYSTVSADTLPFIHLDTTYVSARFFAQATGCLIGWDTANRTVIFTDVERIRADYQNKFSMVNNAFAFMYPSDSFRFSGTVEGSFEFSPSDDSAAALPFSVSLAGTASAHAIEFSAQTNGQAGQDILPDNLPAAFQTAITASHTVDGLLSLPENSLFLRSELLRASGVPEQAYVRLPLPSALDIFGAKTLSAGIIPALMQHDFSLVPAAACRNLSLTDSTCDYILAVRSLFDTYANLYGNARFDTAEHQQILTLQSTDGQGTHLTEQLIIALENSAVAGVSYCTMADYADGAQAARNIDWFGGGNLSYQTSAFSNSYQLDMEGQIHASASDAAPHTVPSGTIVP